jgi:hypothetical protein
MACRAVLVALACAALSCRGKAPSQSGKGSAADASASTSSTPEPPPSALALRPADGDQVEDPRFDGWFPSALGGLKLDPHADRRVFGGRASFPLADVAELVALEPARVESSGLREVLAAGYVPERDDGGRVAASILRFGSLELAFAFFTARILEATELGREPTPFKAGAAAVLDRATALAVRGEAVVRLDYTNPRFPPERVAPAARPVLTVLAPAIAERLPGDDAIPAAARLLPVEARVPLSLRYDAVDLVGFEGAGPGALAAYRDGEQRYRVALAVRIDADAAEDVLSTLRKREGSRVLKSAPYDAIRVAEREPADGAVREWIFGHKGVLVAGVALDAPPRAAPRGAPPERDRAILKLKRLLDALPSRAAW